jgi:hypothetical protein
LWIDIIDLAYYTVADGDGQTTAAREAGADVGGDKRPAAKPALVIVVTLVLTLPARSGDTP